ncbi:MAG: hypothetical protein KF716_28140, partial [Anaerolineae bacterium]|nr:hypothetical protein [Anaerolineae bacterium]
VTAFILCLVVLVGSGSAAQAGRTQAPPTTDPDQIDYMDFRREFFTACAKLIEEQKCDPDFNAYTNALMGKAITWQGWVSDVEKQDDNSGHYLVGIDMDDFDTMDDWPPLSWGYEGVRRIGFADVVLRDVQAEQVAELRTGQHVVFTGRLQGTDTEFGRAIAIDFITSGLAVVVDQVDVFAADPTIDFTLKPTTVITLSRPTCHIMDNNCYTYHLVVYGDGRVIYKFRPWENKPVAPLIKTAVVDVEKVRALLKHFENAHYFGLQDNYSHLSFTDADDATTSLTLGTMRKSIYHYYGDTSAPDVLTELEKLVDETANIAQFAPPSSQ